MIYWVLLFLVLIVAFVAALPTILERRRKGIDRAKAARGTGKVF